MIKIICLIDSCELKQLSLMQNAGSFAIQLYYVSIVSNENECAVFSLLKKLNMAAFVEARITDNHRLVNQETVKLNGH